MRITALTAGIITAGLMLATSPASAQTEAPLQTNLANHDEPYVLGDLQILPKHAADAQVLSAHTEQAAPEDTKQDAEAKPAAKAEPKPKIVTVVKGDHLSAIAKKHGVSVQRLYDANTSIANPNIINPGDKIRIPFDDEKLANRPMPQPKPVAKVASKSTKKSYSSNRKISTNAPAVASGSVWDRLAACESGGNWAINTGNGYYGGLQFLPSTWRAVGGTGLPHQHSREEQIKRAEILLARSGWGQWPACTAILGLR